MAVFTFINVWWLMLFFVIPFGVRTSDNPSPVEYAAAPQPHRWKKMVIINTLISLTVTMVIALVIKSSIVPLHNIS